MKKILIIEDDSTIAEVEKDYLQMSGFNVDIETDGRAGLNRALKHEYDLIILDLMLPNVDGFELCEKIRKEKDIPLIMVSARTEDFAKTRGFELGLDDYMTKPFSPSELVARVKGHLTRYENLTRKPTEERELISIKGLVIDLTARRVFINEKELVFTVKEYELLVLLASHPDRVFSKEEIFQKIWGFNSEGDIPTITVHIRRIREKIEADPSKPQYIATVWGIGYKFLA